jgi:hypothetical protein
MRKIWDLKVLGEGCNAFFSKILVSRHAHSFLTCSLLTCLHNSKRYFKLPLVVPIAKKIISKKTRNEKFMVKCLVTNMCSMMGMFTFLILFFISKGIRVQIHTTNSFVFEFIV